MPSEEKALILPKLNNEPISQVKDLETEENSDAMGKLPSVVVLKYRLISTLSTFLFCR